MHGSRQKILAQPLFHTDFTICNCAVNVHLSLNPSACRPRRVYSRNRARSGPLYCSGVRVSTYSPDPAPAPSCNATRESSLQAARSRYDLRTLALNRELSLGPNRGPSVSTFQGKVTKSEGWSSHELRLSPRVLVWILVSARR